MSSDFILTLMTPGALLTVLAVLMALSAELGKHHTARFKLNGRR
jgi:hypothetical protein